MQIDHALKMRIIDHAPQFTFYILGEAATLEILKSCSVFQMSLFCKSLKSFWLLHTARMVVTIDQTVPIYCKIIVRFKLCSCLGGATFLRAEIPPPENHTILYCLLVFFSCEHVGTTNTRAQSGQLAPTGSCWALASSAGGW